MAQLINLNRMRKARARHEKEKGAEANRALHGLAKHARELAKARSKKARADLDAHKKD